MINPNESTSKPLNGSAGQIRRAFRSPQGRYFEFCGPEGCCWFSIEELIGAEKSVRSRISTRTGVMMVGAAYGRALQEAVQSWSHFDEGVVATNPGWHGDAFVFGTGEVLSTATTPVVVAFEGRAKFAPVGTLDTWQSAIAPFVDGQALPLFVLGFALSGPLLRFAPSSFLPPQMELFGEAASGKTTLGVLAASVWAGSAESRIGGGESWDLTINTIDRHRQQHNDMVLYQDDATLIAGSAKEQAKLRLDAVMKSAGTQVKQRYDDATETPPLRSPRICSSNESLSVLAGALSPDLRDAHMSRVLLVQVNRESHRDALTLFSAIPAGFADVATAASELRKRLDRDYASAGPAFVAYIQTRLQVDPGWRDKVQERLISVAASTVESDAVEQRHDQMLAMVQVALELAMDAGVLRAEWGSPDRVAHQIRSHVCSSRAVENSSYALRAITAYFETHRSKLYCTHLPLVSLPGKAPTPLGVYQLKAGALDLFIDPHKLSSSVRDAIYLLKTAKREGLLVTNPSEGDRLTMHPPKRIARFGFGRMHHFRLDYAPD